MIIVLLSGMKPTNFYTNYNDQKVQGFIKYACLDTIFNISATLKKVVVAKQKCERPRRICRLY